MSVFEFHDYRDFLRSWVSARPKNGRGEWSRISKHLGVSTTMMSQVMASERNLNQELASELADFLGMTDEETNYFILLVDHARAGSSRLREKLKRRIQMEQKRATQLVQRLKHEKEMSEATKATFYSEWLYSGVRNLTSLKDYGDAEAISARLGVPRAQVLKVIEFLLQEGLCKIEQGQLQVGPRSTHVSATSPWVVQHHRNWRLKALQHMRDSDEKNVFYTGPMSLSEETAAVIRKEIPTFLERVYKLVGPSPSEVVRCLNIDWFEY